MRKTTLSVLRVTAIGLAGALMGCASSDGNVRPSQFLASQAATTPENASVAVQAPADSMSHSGEPKGTRDPFETENRSVFEFNQRFNRTAFYPVAKAYRETVPEPVRDSIESFASNLGEPLVFTNDLLQLRFDAAATTVGRFVMNSTAGIGGLFDVATKQNLLRQSGDFGQTLHVWGVRDSDYLVVPIIGPTNTRDLIGTTVEFVAMIPFSWLLPTHFAVAARGLSISGSTASAFTKLDKVGDMETLEASSIDFYSMVQSVVTQKREAELKEALATSGWTALSNVQTTESATPSPFPKPVSVGGMKPRPTPESSMQ
jgi:phospholipid-binding lipoprotein MlaA